MARRKVSEKELERIERGGGRRKRRMGTAEAPPPKPEPAPEVPHASMAASMEASEANQQATHMLLAQNAEAIATFRESLDELKDSCHTHEPFDYDFDVIRDDDKLMKKVEARYIRK